MQNFLDFEKPLLEIHTKIEELRHLKADSKNIANELTYLQEKYDDKLQEIYSNLTPWQKVKVCRHQDRPKINDFIDNSFENFVNLCGDRLYSEDSALRGGIGQIEGNSVVVLGNDKGHNIDSRVKNNFGMAKPEGYRKAIRLITIANKFKFPIVTFIDTPGAFPGVEAEDRGQSEAIASSIKACLKSSSPIFSFIVGEGGSGGAIALGVGNEVVMLEHSVYSVISPEGCASILWRDSEMADQAATSLKLTAQDLFELKVIDEIIEEPIGGAHRNTFEMCNAIKNKILIFLEKYKHKTDQDILNHREKKFLDIGEKFLAD